jgi:hypothetical protein
MSALGTKARVAGPGVPVMRWPLVQIGTDKHVDVVAKAT